jgi:hypothetical protein
MDRIDQETQAVAITLNDAIERTPRSVSLIDGSNFGLTKALDARMPPSGPGRVRPGNTLTSD